MVAGLTQFHSVATRLRSGKSFESVTPHATGSYAKSLQRAQMVSSVSMRGAQSTRSPRSSNIASLIENGLLMMFHGADKNFVPPAVSSARRPARIGGHGAAGIHGGAQSRAAPRLLAVNGGLRLDVTRCSCHVNWHFQLCAA